MPFSGLVSYADPLHVGRHPFQTYLLVLCVVSGIPLLAGRPNSGSVEANLPIAVAIAWGAVLCVGAAIALVGTYWPVRGDHRNASAYATALMLERIGLALAGPGALVYSVIIVVGAGSGGIFAGLLTAGFGVAASRRVRDVGRVFKKALEITDGRP